MADEKKQPTSGVGVKTTEIETGIGADAGMTLSFGTGGEQELHEQTEGGTQSIDVGMVPDKKVDEKAADEEAKVDAEEGGDETKTEEDDGSKAETLAELPDFEDKPEVIATYEKRYTKEGGGLNLDAFNADWWASVTDGDVTKGSLPEGTYKFLETQYGLSKDEVKDIEAGQIAQRQAEAGSLTARAGGTEVYKAALLWGRKGGYTEAQVEAFNNAVNGRDRGVANDAVDLLMARFDKASRSKVSPRKSAVETGTGGGSERGGDVFKTKADWVAARKEAGRDMVKQQAVSNKFRRSDSGKWQ